MRSPVGALRLRARYDCRHSREDRARKRFDSAPPSWAANHDDLPRSAEPVGDHASTRVRSLLGTKRRSWTERGRAGGAPAAKAPLVALCLEPPSLSKEPRHLVQEASSAAAFAAATEDPSQKRPHDFTTSVLSARSAAGGDISACRPPPFATIVSTPTASTLSRRSRCR